MPTATVWVRRFPASACFSRRSLSALSRSCCCRFCRMFATELRAFMSSRCVAVSITSFFACAEFSSLDKTVCQIQPLPCCGPAVGQCCLRCCNDHRVTSSFFNLIFVGSLISCICCVVSCLLGSYYVLRSYSSLHPRTHAPWLGSWIPAG